MTKIQLDADAIKGALPQVAPGLRKYSWLQARLFETDVSRDAEYQTRFNGFYRVRRNKQWRQVFFEILERTKPRPLPFDSILNALHVSTGRVEASFASKLVATLDPSKPVIDSIVLQNLGYKLPTGQLDRRIHGIEQLHRRLSEDFDAYLATEQGRYLVDRFRETYPTATVTEVKMLDLVLWQTRAT